MRKISLIITGLLLLLGNLLLAQTDPIDSLEMSKPNVHYLSLQQALDYADKNNVQVKNALLDVKLQEQVNREVTGNAYPQISGNGQLTYNAELPTSLVPAEFFGGKPGEFARLQFGVKWTSTAGISLSQLLFDGQVFTGLQARETLLDFSNKKVEVTREQIRANIAKIYYQLSVSKTQIDLLDSNIALVNKNIHDTKIMYDNGFAERLEIDKLRVNVANLYFQKTRALNQVSNGYYGLKVLMGMPVTEGLVLTEGISDETVKEGILEAGTFDYDRRRDFQLANLGSRLMEYDIQRYKLSKLPTLALSGYYNEMAQSDKFNIYGPHSYWSPVSAISLNLSVPIFKGFATNAKIAQARIKWQQSQNELETLKNNIDNERLTAINNFKSAIIDLDYQRENIKLAERVYQQTKKKYEVGTGTQIEIDAARVQLQAAQNNYYTALYNAVVARVDYLKATGQF